MYLLNEFLLETRVEHVHHGVYEGRYVQEVDAVQPERHAVLNCEHSFSGDRLRRTDFGKVTRRETLQ